MAGNAATHIVERPRFDRRLIDLTVSRLRVSDPLVDIKHALVPLKLETVGL